MSKRYDLLPDSKVKTIILFSLLRNLFLKTMFQIGWYAYNYSRKRCQIKSKKMLYLFVFRKK